ncbi:MULTISPECIES: PEP-CTERM sorting domain-containing protein [unclassified Duganella]|uniref:PEP-CTERM sorting domain-containing protein n=1 Tax=unclassified Duganella TaxID=2636909 RepID=UPI0008896679|nr:MULTISPECIES: PEP-CTERM sorting domain-containing protein [unclassified Duganella]SDG56913.1 PEP-CTERM motif-containing protein [Duganella sp. OV458]SDJ79912.1 PEP-CTERM motif-containing protein [Duganella sp. OV510]
MKIKFALKAAALAATLVFSGASQAAAGINYNPVALGTVYGGAWLDTASHGEQGLSVYELTGTTLGDAILAFCIEPATAQGPFTTYTQGSSSSLSNLFPGALGSMDRAARIHSLFEQSYAGLSTGSATENIQNRLAFQVALWDLVADDGNLATGSQHLNNSIAFYSTGDDFVELDLGAANTMLENSKTVVTTNSYKYTTFSGVYGGANTPSQMLLSVSAVPEADTWAMMMVGLGLLGFMGRRKAGKGEKFAA